MRSSLIVILSFVFFMGFGQLSAQTYDIYSFPPGLEGLEEMIEFLQSASDAERRNLTECLMADEADYDSVFTKDFSKRVQRFHKRMRKQYDLVIKPLLDDQTEYICWETTREELIAYTGEARNFPGGYKEIAPYFKPGFALYRFKFIKPGMRLGSAYDILVHVNGRWRIFPRPWVMADELMRY